jgi:hypothetical protein
MQSFLKWRKDAQDTIATWPDDIMTVAFIGVAIVALIFAFLVHNRVARISALAYFLLP